MGRRTKLNDEVQAIIVGALRAGNYVETAAQAAGITKVTLYEWLKRGEEEPESIYADFANAVEKARAESEQRDIGIIDRAAHDGSWQAAAWKLERRFPQRWGRLVRTEVTGADGSAVKVEVDHKRALLDLLGIADADSGDT
jgi:transposase